MTLTDIGDIFRGRAPKPEDMREIEAIRRRNRDEFAQFMASREEAAKWT